MGREDKGLTRLGAHLVGWRVTTSLARKEKIYLKDGMDVEVGPGFYGYWWGP